MVLIEMKGDRWPSLNDLSLILTIVVVLEKMVVGMKRGCSDR